MQVEVCLTRKFQPREIWHHPPHPPISPGHLAMSGDLYHCHNWRSLLASSGQIPKMLLNIPHSTGQLSTIKNHPAQKVNCAKVEKSWSNPIDCSQSLRCFARLVASGRENGINSFIRQYEESVSQECQMFSYLLTLKSYFYKSGSGNNLKHRKCPQMYTMTLFVIPKK